VLMLLNSQKTRRFKGSYKVMATNNDIRVTYRSETARDIAALADNIASNQSSGTLTELAIETKAVRTRCAAQVISIRSLEPLNPMRWWKS